MATLTSAADSPVSGKVGPIFESVSECGGSFTFLLRFLPFLLFKKRRLEQEETEETERERKSEDDLRRFSSRFSLGAPSFCWRMPRDAGGLGNSPDQLTLRPVLKRGGLAPDTLRSCVLLQTSVHTYTIGRVLCSLRESGRSAVGTSRQAIERTRCCTDAPLVSASGCRSKLARPKKNEGWAASVG